MVKKIPLVGIVCIGFAALLFIDKWQVTQWRAKKSMELSATAELCRVRLENAIANRFKALEAMAALFVLHPDPPPDDFAVFATLLLQSNPPIRMLQYADAKTRVTYGFPPPKRQ